MHAVGKYVIPAIDEIGSILLLQRKSRQCIGINVEVCFGIEKSIQLEGTYLHRQICAF